MNDHSSRLKVEKPFKLPEKFFCFNYEFPPIFNNSHICLSSLEPDLGHISVNVAEENNHEYDLSELSYIRHKRRRTNDKFLTNFDKIQPYESDMPESFETPESFNEFSSLEPNSFNFEDFSSNSSLMDYRTVTHTSAFKLLKYPNVSRSFQSKGFDVSHQSHNNTIKNFIQNKSIGFNNECTTKISSNNLCKIFAFKKKHLPKELLLEPKDSKETITVDSFFEDFSHESSINDPEATKKNKSLNKLKEEIETYLKFFFKNKVQKTSNSVSKKNNNLPIEPKQPTDEEFEFELQAFIDALFFKFAKLYPLLIRHYEYKIERLKKETQDNLNDQTSEGIIKRKKISHRMNSDDALNKKVQTLLKEHLQIILNLFFSFKSFEEIFLEEKEILQKEITINKLADNVNIETIKIFQLKTLKEIFEARTKITKVAFRGSETPQAYLMKIYKKRSNNSFDWLFNLQVEPFMNLLFYELSKNQFKDLNLLFDYEYDQAKNTQNYQTLDEYKNNFIGMFKKRLRYSTSENIIPNVKHNKVDKKAQREQSNKKEEKKFKISFLVYK